MKYETSIKAGKFLLIAHGTADEAVKAKDILSRTKSSEVTDHPLTAVPQAS